MRNGCILFFLAILLCCTGCGKGLPQAREMNNMALMRTMAVDRGETRDKVLVTVSSARRSRGVQGESEPPLVLSAQRETIAGACRAIENMSENDVFFGHVDQLLLGEDLARSGGIFHALEHFNRESELGLGAQVWIVRDKLAQMVLQAKEEQGIEPRLTALIQDNRLGIAGMERTAGAVLSKVMEKECPWIPALGLDEENGSLWEMGYGVLKEGNLVFWVEGDAARGLELSQGYPGGELIELSGGVAQLDSAALTCIPVLKEERLVGLELDLRLLGRVKLSGTLGGKGLEEGVQERAAGWLNAALTLAQESSVDFMGLKRMAGSSRPEEWKNISEQWESVFPELEIQVHCTATLTDEKE